MPDVAVAWVVLVFDDLLDGAAGIDAERFQFDLGDGHAVDEQNDVVTVMAVVRVDAQLADDLERVLAPVLNVDERVVQRRAVVAREGVAGVQRLGGFENVGVDDFIQQALEFTISKRDAVKRLKLLAEIRFQRGAVADVGSKCVLQINQPGDQFLFDAAFCCCHCRYLLNATRVERGQYKRLSRQRRASALHGQPFDAHAR